MTDGLNPYPKYKDSGVPWLGKVPEHWEVQKTERNRPELPLLSVVREKGVILRDINDRDANRNYIPDDLSNYKVVRAGQFAMNKMKAWQGSYGVSSFDGIVSPAYFVFDLVGVGGRYFHIAIRSKAYIPFFTQASDGVRIGQWDLSQARMREVPFFIPPLLEQTAIVRFLDWMDRRIRRVIRARQRRIKLLEEYKQALINRAVTGKIDVRTGKPYPKYKHSGVEWLGEVPEHWEVRPLKRIARLNPSKSELSPALRSADAVFLPMEKVGADGRIDTSIVKCVSELWNGFTYFRQNDVIVAKITPCFENGKGACLTNLPTEIGFGSTEFHVLRPSSAILPEFLYLVTILREFRQLGVEAMTGAAGQQRVPSTFIEQFPTCRPPLSEQTAIVEFLDEQTERIDAAIAADRQAIDLLKEFRTRLEADVVTGKLDVREAAAKLPDEPPEEEAGPLDEEETAEDDKVAGETDLEAVSEEGEV